MKKGDLLTDDEVESLVDESVSELYHLDDLDSYCKTLFTLWYSHDLVKLSLDYIKRNIQFKSKIKDSSLSIGIYFKKDFLSHIGEDYFYSITYTDPLKLALWSSLLSSDTKEFVFISKKNKFALLDSAVLFNPDNKYDYKKIGRSYNIFNNFLEGLYMGKKTKKGL
jgi:hypothetical protein